MGETTASGDRELRVGVWGKPQHQGTENSVWVNHSIRGQRTQGGSLGETTASGDRDLRVGVWVKPQHQGTENSGWEFG